MLAVRAAWVARRTRLGGLKLALAGTGLSLALLLVLILQPALLDEFRVTTIQLPMRPEVRSLNLASTVNTAVYEAVRQFGGLRAES